MKIPDPSQPHVDDTCPIDTNPMNLSHADTSRSISQPTHAGHAVHAGHPRVDHGEHAGRPTADIDRLLLRTSRTFALAIPELPEPLRREVGVAYLLFRIADTFEDANRWA